MIRLSGNGNQDKVEQSRKQSQTTNGKNREDNDNRYTMFKRLLQQVCSLAEYSINRQGEEQANEQFSDEQLVCEQE